jgi:8-oxo-dGTP pyrophosphatase MutT (NUDIX family)
LTNKICAIRETFEESGLLLSNPPVNTIKDLDVNVWRHKVHDDASQFKVMCDKYNIQPAVEKLVPFSNWITPVIEKKRYNTLFFLTVLDEYKTKTEQDLHLNVVAADGKETVLFDWFKPEEGKSGCFLVSIYLLLL